MQVHPVISALWTETTFSSKPQILSHQRLFFSGRCWAEAFYYKQMGKIFQLPIIQSNKEACSLI